jgi:hypothetical protein
VVSHGTTAARALKRSKGKADIEIVTAMVAQALAERLEVRGAQAEITPVTGLSVAPPNLPREEGWVSASSTTSSARLWAFDARSLAGKAQQEAATATIGSEVVMGSPPAPHDATERLKGREAAHGSGSPSPSPPAAPDAPEPRFENFTVAYESGVVIEAYYPTGATLREARVGHVLATVEPVESSRIEADRP